MMLHPRPHQLFDLLFLLFWFWIRNGHWRWRLTDSNSGDSPGRCGSEIPLRTVQEYQSYYDQNLSDDRCGGYMNLTGKHHYSVAAPMIFPISDLSYIVPPSLHIMLYNLLLNIFIRAPFLPTDCKTCRGNCGRLPSSSATKKMLFLNIGLLKMIFLV